MAGNKVQYALYGAQNPGFTQMLVFHIEKVMQPFRNEVTLRQGPNSQMTSQYAVNYVGFIRRKVHHTRLQYAPELISRQSESILTECRKILDFKVCPLTEYGSCHIIDIGYFRIVFAVDYFDLVRGREVLDPYVRLYRTTGRIILIGHNIEATHRSPVATVNRRIAGE